MSTRANYEFLTPGKNKILFYIHHDGYPEGAAHYFENAMIHRRGKLTYEAFLKYNDNCEPTDDEHGDIEYYYQINEETQDIFCYKVDFETGHKTLYKLLKAPEFVNKYYQVFQHDEEAMEIKSREPWATEESINRILINRHEWRYRKHATRWDIGEPKQAWVNIAMMKLELEAAQQEFDETIEKWTGDNPNTQRLKDYLFSLYNEISLLTWHQKEEAEG